MRKRVLILLCIAALLLGTFAGCGETVQQVPDNAKSVNLVNKIGLASVGEKYNLSKIIIEQRNVEYTATASYVDPDTGKTVDLEVTELCFVPDKKADILVKITGTSDKETYYSEITIPMEEHQQTEELIQTDALDALLASDGAAGEADEGVIKTVVFDSQYIKNDASVTALQVDFHNPEAADEGTFLVNLSNCALTPYYSARVWENAAVSFWAYNPMEKDIQFKLSSFNEYTAENLFWNSDNNTQVQTAKAGEWTLIQFSLYQMGIENVLFTDGTGIHTSQLKLLARYAGDGECTVYVDGLDVLPADAVEGLETGFVDIPAPEGNFVDLLEVYEISTNNDQASLSVSDNSNGGENSVCFGASEPVGWPSFRVDFGQELDLSGFDYLKFDMYAEKCYPWASVSVIYIDENGEEQRATKGFDTYREQWRTIYLNLDYLTDADLTRAVGLGFSINVSDNMVKDEFNCVYFDNVCLYERPNAQPDLPAAVQEDDDLISGSMTFANTLPGINGVCKVSQDEAGEAKSNSHLVFWTNTASGYPCVSATFMFDEEQDWSKNKIFSFDSHMDGAHYLLMFTLYTLDEFGNEQQLTMRTDTVLTHWMTNSAPLNWFKAEDGSTPDLSRVIGMSVAVDLAVNVTKEVGHIFLDNVYIY